MKLKYDEPLALFKPCFRYQNVRGSYVTGQTLYLPAPAQAAAVVVPSPPKVGPTVHVETRLPRFQGLSALETRL